VCLYFIFMQESRKQVWGRSLDIPNVVRLHHSTIQVHTLHTLHIHIYLGLCRILSPTWQIKKNKMFLIMINLTLWYFLKKLAIIENHFKTLCYLSHCGMWDGRVWVPYSWYHCHLENLFQKLQNSSYHSQCFICLINLKI